MCGTKANWPTIVLLLLAIGGLLGCAPVTPAVTPASAVPAGRPPGTPLVTSPTLVPTSEGEQAMTLPMETLRQGDQWPTRIGPAFAVITGPEAWARFLRQHGGRVEDWPAVDWDNNLVLVGLMGPKRTGGYRITLAKVTVRGDAVTVHVEETRPRPGDMVIQVLTSPFHVVVVPRSGWPTGGVTVRFVTPENTWEVAVPGIEKDAIFIAGPGEASELPGQPTGAPTK